MEVKIIIITKKLISMSIISTFFVVPGQPSPRFHVEAWLPFRNSEMDYLSHAAKKMTKTLHYVTLRFSGETPARMLLKERHFLAQGQCLFYSQITFCQSSNVENNL